MSHPCINCGSEDTAVITEDPTHGNHKLKCYACKLMFNKNDSVALQERGELPTPPPTPPKEALDKITPSEPNSDQPPLHKLQPSEKFPRSPSYAIMSKDRSHVEFATKKDLKVKVLRWEAADTSYDVFELTPKKVQAKLSIE